MRIGIDALVAPGPHTGVGRQLDGLIRSLPQVDTANEYLLVTDRRRPWPVRAANFRPLVVPVSATSRLANHLFTALVMPLLAARHDLAVLHIPNTMPLLYRRRPTIVTLYDLTEFALPQRVYRAGRHAYRRLVNRLAARRADLVITTSLSTQVDIERYLGVPPARIRVIYPGIDHNHFRPQAIAPARRASLARTYGLPDRYLLHVGKIQPRKNLARLLHAFHRIRPAHPGVHLVLAGARGWLDQEIGATIAALDLAAAVHCTGVIAEADLPALYRLAELFVYPSLYEGFGFPLLEAMACGTPVVASTTSSLAEVAGGAALGVDPTSVEAIAAALDRGLSDGALRAELRQKGRVRAADFTWARCAAETVGCYQAVARPPATS